MLLKKLRELASKLSYGLVILDSFMNFHRTHYLQLFALPEHQKRIDSVLKYLRDFATAFGAAVVITNDSISNIGANVFGPITTATGRKLTKTSEKNHRFTLTIEKSSVLPVLCLSQVISSSRSSLSQSANQHDLTARRHRANGFDRGSGRSGKNGGREIADNQTIFKKIPPQIKDCHVRSPISK